MKSADQAVTNWSNGMAGAGQAYTQGVQQTTKDPMQAAAAAVDSGYYLQRVTAAQGRMAARLRSTPKSAWVDGCVKVGSQRLATGAQKGKPKYAAAVQRLQPIWQQMRAAADAIPKGGLASAQAKANAALAVLMQQTGKA